ncbi:MAG: hypothetical protein OXT67_06330 [Zetaproteobacteria bacterium]|nr:hypothetical protein [Zetaproteobacteria bacterium]
MSIRRGFGLSALVFLWVSGTQGGAAAPIVLNIDHPQFRQMTVAIPEVAVQYPGSIPDWGLDASPLLEGYLNLSGYFRVLDRQGYQGLWPEKSFAWGSPLAKTAQKMDRSTWKQLGAEALLLVKAAPRGRAVSLELTLTEIRGQDGRTLAKEYRVASRAQLQQTLKKFVDEVLRRLSGKPGIYGTKIVFVGKKTARAHKAIYMCDVDGSNVEQLTQTRAIHLSPSWHPEGKAVLFTSYERGNPDLYQMTLPGRRKSIVSAEKGLNSGGAFSPDGKTIVFSGSSGGGNTDIYLKTDPLKGRKRFIYGTGLDVNPVFSPNGKWLAFVSGRYGNPHIFRAELEWNRDRQSFRVVKDIRLTYAGWYNASPAWSPDSDRIAFAGFDRAVGRFDLFTMKADGTQMERLTLRHGDNESPSWSPNGQLLVFSSNRVADTNRKGPFQIYIMRRDGSHETKLDVGMYSADSPKWSPVLDWVSS